jgi:hypothetical protein
MARHEGTAMRVQLEAMIAALAGFDQGDRLTGDLVAALGMALDAAIGIENRPQGVKLLKGTALAGS